MNSSQNSDLTHAYDGTTKPNQRAHEDYMSPARRVSIIRAKHKLVDEMSERILSAPESAVLGARIQVGLLHAEIITHLTRLEDEGHLKTFQELLVAETEVAR